MNEEINVHLRSNPLELIAEVYIASSDATIYAASRESWVDAIAELRPALAGLGFTGRMILAGCNDLFHSDEKFDEAVALFDKGLTISAEYAEQVRRGES